MQELKIESHENMLVCAITPDAITESGASVAFYVYRGPDRIHTQWYSNTLSLNFDTQGIPGSYRIVAFIRQPDGSVVNLSSTPLSIHGYREVSAVKHDDVEALEAEQRNGRIVCTIKLLGTAEPDLNFAFYVFRNDQRIHQQWYSSSPTLDWDAQGVPGYYRVTAFAKHRDGSIENAKSVPLFMNPRAETPDEFPLAASDTGAFMLKGKHWNFPALYFPGTEPWLYVMTPSAIDRNRMTLPVFSRWTWAMKGFFPGHVLCVADPTLELDEELKLGWCLGTSTRPATDEIVEFIEKFAAAKGIPRRNIVIWGSSAGGFAALSVASRIPGSTAVAINAQTDALSYEIRKQVALIRTSCFATDSDAQIRAAHGEMIDMNERWKHAAGTRAFVVQNKLDVHHYNMHFKRFWESLGGIVQDGLSKAGSHVAWVYEDVNGHVAETPEMVQKIIQIINSDFAID